MHRAGGSWAQARTMTDILNQIGSALGGLVDSSAVQADGPPAVPLSRGRLGGDRVVGVPRRVAPHDEPAGPVPHVGPVRPRDPVVLRAGRDRLPRRPSRRDPGGGERARPDRDRARGHPHARRVSVVRFPDRGGLAALSVVPLRAARAVPAVYPAGRGRVAGLPVVRRRAAVAARPRARDARSAGGPDGVARLGRPRRPPTRRATPDGPPADEVDTPEPATTGSSGRSSTAIW